MTPPNCCMKRLLNRAGAQGYVLKGADPAEILRAIEAVANAQAIFGTAIAHQLDLSEKTVRNNVSTIFIKLHVADRAAAVARARDAGLGQTSR
jgi:DNA-binding NarL/FixJ family response regulator